MEPVTIKTLLGSRLSLIVARTQNNVIGRDNALPWKLPHDLKRFQEITMGSPVIMGRITWQSLPRPLAGRQNIVMTRQEGYTAEGATVVDSLEAACMAALFVPGGGEIFVIGGGDIYRQFLQYAHTVYETVVHIALFGDKFFPSLCATDWETTAATPAYRYDGDQYPTSFQICKRHTRS